MDRDNEDADLTPSEAWNNAEDDAADHEPTSGPQTEVKKLRIKNKSKKRLHPKDAPDKVTIEDNKENICCNSDMVEVKGEDGERDKAQANTFRSYDAEELFDELAQNEDRDDYYTSSEQQNETVLEHQPVAKDEQEQEEKCKGKFAEIANSQ